MNSWSKGAPKVRGAERVLVGDEGEYEDTGVNSYKLAVGQSKVDDKVTL